MFCLKTEANIIRAPSIRWCLSGDGLMDPTGGLGLWGQALPLIDIIIIILSYA